MKKLFSRIGNWLRPKVKAVTPGRIAVQGAVWGLMIVTITLWCTFWVILNINTRDPWIWSLFVLFSLVAILFGLIVTWLINKINGIPRSLKRVLLMAFPLIMLMTAFEPILVAFIMIIGLLTGAGIWVVRKTGLKSLSTPKKIVTIIGLVLGFAGIVTSSILYSAKGYDLDPFIDAAKTTSENVTHIDAPDPGMPGSFTVKTLTYGSGKDKHRPEFGEEADFVTDSVNGVAFIDNWKGLSGWWRTKYWGFDSKSLPLNARVWYPEGDGPFPLVLVVHGNHVMQDYSDPGYDYLGELLASRGIILASVDENFINGSWSDLFKGLDKENDARGWLLLEHFRLWHEWNSDADHPFYGIIDTTRLALIGHSRGGEAVAHAAMFNALSYYPDDGSIEFDYNYHIRSIVAIAPVDGQYEPGETRTRFENVSYFVLHGSQDGDVRSFMGSQQYERIKFSDSLYHFKSGLYIFGANHGQFNTSWGDNDSGRPFAGLLNFQQMLAKEDQEKIAEVYISAFLEATLHEAYEYLPLFADSRTGRNWLPETLYLNQFEDSNAEFICTYDEDLDISTNSENNIALASTNLTVWKEQEIRLQWQKKGSRAVVLGWHYEEDKDNGIMKDTLDAVAGDWVPDSLIASYTIELDAAKYNLDSNTVFIFSMAESTESSNPKTSGKWVNDNDKNKKEEEVEDEDEGKEQDGKDEDEDEAKPPIDFSIFLTDAVGNRITFPISHFSSLQREINVVIWKIDFLLDKTESEKVFQLFAFPLDDLVLENPRFDLSSLQSIQFVFDKSDKGVVVVDNIGFMKDLQTL